MHKTRVEFPDHIPWPFKHYGTIGYANVEAFTGRFSTLKLAKVEADRTFREVSMI